MSHNPWQGMPQPKGESYFKTKRVDISLNTHDLPISWAVDFEGRKGIYFEYPCAKRKSKAIKLPSFWALQMRDIDCSIGWKAFAIMLEESDMDDVFYEICLDLIASVQDMPPNTTRSVLIRRLERWSDLLRGGPVGLSLEAQRGLFAELVFLEDYAIPVMGEANAVDGWIGPEGGHQDFCFGQTSIEVKSKHGSLSSKVKISSEHQLSVNMAEKLFLFVIEENESYGEVGTSLSELATRIKGSINSPIIRTAFVSKLLAVGYDFSSIYDRRWTVGLTSIFEVDEGFPRIVNVANGLSQISYTLDLAVCDAYSSNVTAMLDCMKGDND